MLVSPATRKRPWGGNEEEEEIPLRRFNTGTGVYETLGNCRPEQGAFGQVFCCRLKGEQTGDVEGSSSALQSSALLVAVKSFRSLFNANAMDTMAVEVAALRSINHPSVVQLLDEGPDFIVLEYWPETLFSQLEQGNSLYKQAAAILGQLLLATDAVHRAGFAHLDIKVFIYKFHTWFINVLEHLTHIQSVLC
jgi:serine/threonine protein kinase